MEKKFYPASFKRKSFAVILDFFFTTIFWSLYFLFFESEIISNFFLFFLIQERFLISYLLILSFLVLFPLPLILFLLFFRKTPGQHLSQIWFIAWNEKKATLKEKMLHTYLSLYIFIFFFSIPNIVLFLTKKGGTLSEKILRFQQFQKKPHPSRVHSSFRVLAILLLCWLVPTNLVFWKKTFINLSFSSQGLVFFSSNKDWLQEKKKRNLKKNIRKPSNFKDFFQELRWSLMWNDLERHMHLLTPSSQILVGLNLDLYKKSLPKDIIFSKVEKTWRKNYFKLYYYRKEENKQTKNLDFFYLTKIKNEWKLDQSPIFLNYFLRF